MVVISDMEHIPQNCSECKLRLHKMCPLLNNYVSEFTRDRDKYCPLEEVNDNSVLEQIKSQIPNLARYESADGQDLIMANDIATLIDKYIYGKEHVDEDNKND